MRTSRWIVAALVVGAVAGCGSSDEDQSAELRQYLSDHHGDDRGFDGLGVVEVSDGDVTVQLGEWNSVDYGAYLVCDWVSEWLYSSDAGSPESQVVVVSDGEMVLTRQDEAEDCEAASFRAEYGS